MWVSVKDRLPRAFKDVLVCSKGELLLVCYYHPSSNMFVGKSFQYLLENITHWQALPEPPKVEEVLESA